MGCCGSNQIEQTVVSKVERDEAYNKSPKEITSLNEIKIIDIDSDNIIDFLIFKSSYPLTSFIEYLIYFLNSFHENLDNTSKNKNASEELDSRALKIIRINLQKLQGIIKNNCENIAQIAEDSPNGQSIYKIIHDLDLNIRVLIKGTLPKLISLDLLKDQEKFKSKEFQFILSSIFWKENENLKDATQPYMKWIDFQRRFSDFALKYFKTELNEQTLDSVKSMVDLEENQMIFYKNWDDFYKNNWVFWKTRKNILIKESVSKDLNECSKQLNLIHIYFNNESNAYEIITHICLKSNEQYFSKGKQTLNKKLWIESVNIGIDENNEIDKTLKQYRIFMKSSDKGFYLADVNKTKASKFLLGAQQYELKNDMIIESKKYWLRVLTVNPNNIIFEIYDHELKLINKIGVNMSNYSEEFKKLGFESDIILVEENEVWMINREYDGIDEQRNVFIFFGDFQELSKRFIEKSETEQPSKAYFIKGNMILNLNENFFILTEGEYIQPSYAIEKNDNAPLPVPNLLNGKNKIPSKKTTNNQQITKKIKIRSNSFDEKNKIITSTGQIINKNLLDKVQVLEKFFNGKENEELKIAEENESPVSLSSSKLRKRSESLHKSNKLYVKSPSGKKSIHVNLIERVRILESHFGSTEEGFSDYIDITEGNNINKKQFVDKQNEEEDEKGMKHLTLQRPKLPYRHKKRSLIRMNSRR